MQKLPRLDMSMIEFKTIIDDEKHTIDYQSFVKFSKMNSSISISSISSIKDQALFEEGIIEEEIKNTHLAHHDQEVYGRFRKEMQEVMFNFLYTINRYDDGKSWKTTVDIPKAELYSLEAKLKSILSGI